MINFYEYFNKSTELNDRYYKAFEQFTLSGMRTPVVYIDQISHILKRSPFLAYCVAKYIYKQRWQDAEKYICSCTTWWRHYKEWFDIK